jgi:hypothetical protein
MARITARGARGGLVPGRDAPAKGTRTPAKHRRYGPCLGRPDKEEVGSSSLLGPGRRATPGGA